MSLPLFHNLRAATSPHARLPIRNLIVEHYAPLVERTARRLCVCWRLDISNHLDDLVSEGYIALIEAVESFNPDHPKGAQFETFAVPVIAAKMAEYVRDRLGLTSAYLASQGVRVSREGDLPDEFELVPFEQQAGGAFAVYELGDAINNALAAVDAELKGEPAKVREIWERDKQVISLRFGKGYGPKEIAEYLGLTSPNVCNSINRALDRLRPHLSELYP